MCQKWFLQRLYWVTVWETCTNAECASENIWFLVICHIISAPEMILPMITRERQNLSHKRNNFCFRLVWFQSKSPDKAVQPVFPFLSQAWQKSWVFLLECFLSPIPSPALVELLSIIFLWRNKFVKCAAKTSATVGTSCMPGLVYTDYCAAQCSCAAPGALLQESFSEVWLDQYPSVTVK